MRGHIVYFNGTIGKKSLNHHQILVIGALNIELISEPSVEELRPTRCVYMENLAESLCDQTWLDTDSLEQVSKGCLV